MKSTLDDTYYLTLKSIILKLDGVYRLFRWLVPVEDCRLFISFSLFAGCLWVTDSVVAVDCRRYDDYGEELFKSERLLLYFYSP